MKIKICGLCREEEIAAVNEVQPDYIGFVFAQGSRRYVDPRQAALLRQGLSKNIVAAGVFTDAPLEQILQLVYEKVIDIVQLHGNETLEFAEDLKCCCDVPVVKAVSMSGDTYSREIKRWEHSCVDYLLLDSGRGGTGTTFDHGRIGSPAKPFFLAGGLTPENVAEAARQVLPYAVDMSSGVETDGRKDKEKIEKAVRRIRDVERKIR